MPGDTYTGNVKIKNTNRNAAKYYLTPNIDEKNKKEIELLNQINLTILNKEGQVICSGKLKNNEKTVLGTYFYNGYDKLDFKLTVPKELDNKYARTKLNLDWIFSVDYSENVNEKDYNEDDKANSETGDRIDVAITIFIISAIGLITIIILNYIEKRSFESINKKSKNEKKKEKKSESKKNKKR